MNDGIILIDKPEGITSASVCEKIKKKLNVKKVGHGGTLDPFATGLLIIGINKGTKLLKYFLEFQKTYEGIITLGEKKDTFDITGKTILKKDFSKIKEKKILNEKNNFIGVIKQKPPIFSALKKNGKPLYKYAREGKTVDIEERFVFVSNFEITNIELPDIYFKIKCSSGTYIRSIANDFGEKLGTYGFLKKLRRIEVGHLSIKNATTIEKVNFDNIIDIENVFNFNSYKIENKKYIKLLQNGNILPIEALEEYDIEKLDDNDFVYIVTERYISIYRYNKKEQKLKPEIVYKKTLYNKNV